MNGSLTLAVSERVGPLRSHPIYKQAVDTRKLTIDFSRWLDADETIASIGNFAIQSSPPTTSGSWTSDFPAVEPVTTPADANPLFMDGASVISAGTQVQLLISGGTPQLSYMVSFLVTAGPTQRQKEVDLFVYVNAVVNANMISSITPPALSVTVVAASVNLATGTTGIVNIQNGTGSAITVQLPSNPVLGQQLDFKDVNGNAFAHHVTVQGASGALIDGSANFVFNENYQAISFRWAGSQWGIL